MLDFFRGDRSWRQFYNFLDRLPPHGHYKTAVAMSPKWAEMVLDMEESGGDESGGDRGLGWADIDLAQVDEVRGRLPAISHRRPIPTPEHLD